MSKQTEALKLAREVLTENREYIQLYERPSYLALYDKAIARVEEALAEQPAQQQEPVACKTLCELCIKRGYIFCANAAQTTPIPSPPASKPWVELTDAQIFNLAEPYGAFEYGDAQGHKRLAFARAIEAKLREKNA